jgi:hypothetical protein
MCYRNILCGAPDHMLIIIFLWRTEAACATEIWWAPPTISLNYWFHYFYGAWINVCQKVTPFYGACCFDAPPKYDDLLAHMV